MQVPCLWFDQVAEEAAAFYVSVFPRSRVVKVTRAPAGTPSVPAGAVLTVDFELDGSRYTALNGGPGFHFTEAVSFAVTCADQDETDHYWDRLGEGGEPGPCGWLKDRYGLSWQVVPTRLTELLGDPDPERAARATAAMLRMGRLVIADVERAADGED